MFAPSIWNVHTITLEDGSRTNNICEGWNNGFFKLVGHSHPTIWRAIDSIRKNQVQYATSLLHDERGEPPAKGVRRQTRQFQINLRNMCADFFLSGVLSEWGFVRMGFCPSGVLSDGVLSE